MMKKLIRFGMVSIIAVNFLTITFAKENTLSEFDSVGDYNEFGVAEVTINGKYGCINEDNEIVIPAEYDELLPDSDGWIMVSKNGLSGYMRYDGTIIIPAVYTQLEKKERNSRDLLPVIMDNTMQLFDDEGRPYYSQVGTISDNGLVPALMSDATGLWGYMNTDGETVIDPWYTDAASFDSYGLAIAKKGEYYGCINELEVTVVPFEYDEIKPFNKSGYALVRNGEVWNYISTMGMLLYDEVIIPEGASISVARKEGKYLFVDGQGNRINDAVYDKIYIPYKSSGLINIEYTQYQYYKTRNNGKYGIVDFEGNQILPEEYDYIYCDDDSVYFPKDDLWGFATIDGDLLLDAQYQSIWYEKKPDGDKYITILTDSNGECTIVNQDNETLYTIPHNNYMSKSKEDNGVSLYYRISSDDVDSETEIGISFDNGIEYEFDSRAFSIAKRFNDDLLSVYDKENRKCGLMDMSGNTIIECKYDLILPLQDEADPLFILSTEDGYCFSDSYGNILNESQTRERVIPILKTEIENNIPNIISGDTGYHTILSILFEKQVKTDISDELWGIVFDNLSEGELIPYSEGEKMGYIDKSGQFVIPPQFDFAEKFDDGAACVTIENASMLINEKGQLLSDKYFSIDAKDEYGHYIVENFDHNKGILDHEGKMVIPDIYYDIYLKEFGTHNYYVIETPDLYGLVNENAEWIFDPQFTALLSAADSSAYDHNHYHEPSNLSGDIILVKDQNDHIQYYQIDGEPLLVTDDWKSLISGEGIITACQWDGYAFFDLNGKQKKHFNYDSVSRIINEYSQFIENGKSGFIDSTGRIVIENSFNDTKYFTEDGLAAVQQDGLWGYINETGEVVGTITFDEVSDFCYGRAAVCKDGKWGYIDTTGQIVIPLQYSSADDFSSEFGDDYRMVYADVETEDGEEIKIDYFGKGR